MDRAFELFEFLKAGGEAAIDELIARRDSEELFLDYKLSADDGGGTTLHRNDLFKLAKAISGFGNSEGGVIVWGVECKADATGADVPTDKHPINDPSRYASWLQSRVGVCTLPPHPGVLHHPIAGAIQGIGFVVTLVPRSRHSPHQVAVKSNDQHRYFMRAGSDFTPVTNGVLEGMFGRAPQPRLREQFVPKRVMWKDGAVTVEVDLQLENVGIGVATDIFLTIASSFGSGPSRAVLRDANSENWTKPIASYGDKHCILTVSGFRLPPGAALHAVPLFFSIAPPFSDDVAVAVHLGASGTAPRMFRLEATAARLQTLHNALSASPSSPTVLLDKSAKPHIDALLGIQCI